MILNNKNPFHYNLTRLSTIDNKFHNPHYLNNIEFYIDRCILETSNNIIKWDSFHCFQIYIICRIHIFRKFAIGNKTVDLPLFTFNQTEVSSMSL